MMMGGGAGKEGVGGRKEEEWGKGAVWIRRLPGPRGASSFGAAPACEGCSSRQPVLAGLPPAKAPVSSLRPPAPPGWPLGPPQPPPRPHFLLGQDWWSGSGAQGTTVPSLQLLSCLGGMGEGGLQTCQAQAPT